MSANTESIVLRSEKGSALTYEEMDSNFLVLAESINYLANGEIVDIVAEYLSTAEIADTLANVFVTIESFDDTVTEINANLDIVSTEVADLEVTFETFELQAQTNFDYLSSEIETNISQVQSTINAVSTNLSLEIDSVQDDVSAAQQLIQDVNTALQGDLSALEGVVNSEITTLTSELDTLTATLALNYYTVLQTDSEINTAVSAVETSLQSNIDSVSSNLSTNYYTIVQTDSEINTAVSAVETSLQSNIDSVSSNLSTNYYTITQTDSEINTAVSAAQTTLQSNIDSVSSNLSTNYYTSTETDSEISTAVSAIETSLQSNIDGVSADLSTNYYTSTETDGEISSAVSALQTTLSSEIGSVADTQSGFQLVYTSTSVGTIGPAVTATTGSGVLGQGGTVIVSEDGLTARNTTGTTNGFWITVPTSYALQFAGRRIKMSVLARQPSTNPASSFTVAYSTSDTGNSGGLTSGTLTTSWQWFSFYWDVTTPNNGATDFFAVFADAAGGSVELSRVIIENAAEAGDIPEIEVLNTTITETAATVDGISGTYSVTIDNNGLISGFALTSDVLSANTGAYSAFTIAADQFSVVDPNDNSISPFSVITSGPDAGVYINASALTINGVTTNLIAPNAVTNAIADSTKYASSGTTNYNITCDAGSSVIIWVNGFVNSEPDQEGGQSASMTIKWNGTTLKTITSSENGYIQVGEILTETSISGVNTLSIVTATSLGGSGNSTMIDAIAIIETKR